MTATSNTGDNRPGTFTKADPRINRKGRPKDFDALRSLAQEIANEKAKSGGSTLVIDGHAVTVAEAILRQWASSKDWQRQKGFIEIAYGKVPDKVQVTGQDGERLTIFYVNNWRGTANAALGTAGGDAFPGPLSLADGRATLAQDDDGDDAGD